LFVRRINGERRYALLARGREGETRKKALISCVMAGEGRRVTSRRARKKIEKRRT